MRGRSAGVICLCISVSCSAPGNRRDADTIVEKVDLSALQAADSDGTAPPEFVDLYSAAAGVCARTMTADVSRTRHERPVEFRSGSVAQLIQRKKESHYRTAMFLPQSLRAGTPDAVRHVVCILETESQVGVYVAEGTNRVVKPAMQTGWEIAVLTWPAGRVVDAQFLQGQLPPARIDSTGAYAPGVAPAGVPLSNQVRDFLLRRLHAAKAVMERPEWTKVSLAAAFSPDGSRLALGAIEPLPDSDLRPLFTTRIIRASDGGVVRFETSRAVRGISGLGWAGDNRTLAMSLLTLGELAAGQKANHIISLEDRTFRLDSRVVVQDSETGKIHWTIADARFLAFSPDGARLATHSEGGVDIWNVAEQRRERTLVTAPFLTIPSADFSANGEIAVMAITDDPFPDGRGSLQLFAVSTGQRIATLDLPGKDLSLEARSASQNRPVRLVRFIAGGRLSFGGWNSLNVWDWKIGRRTEYPLAFSDWTPEMRRAIWFRGLYDLSHPSRVADLPGELVLLSPSGTRVLGVDDDKVKLYFMPDTTR